MRIRSAMSAVALAATSVIGGVATATPSFAAASDCATIHSYSVPGYAGYFCRAGKGYYRAWVKCTAVPGDAFFRKFYGPWVGTTTGGISWADCTTAYPYLADYGGENP